MDNTTKKDMKFIASIFLTIGFHAILWKLIELSCIRAGITDAAMAALCMLIPLSLGTIPFMVSVIDDWLNN